MQCFILKTAYAAYLDFLATVHAKLKIAENWLSLGDSFCVYQFLATNFRSVWHEQRLNWLNLLFVQNKWSKIPLNASNEETQHLRLRRPLQRDIISYSPISHQRPSHCFKFIIIYTSILRHFRNNPRQSSHLSIIVIVIGQLSQNKYDQRAQHTIEQIQRLYFVLGCQFAYITAFQRQH